MSNYKLTYFSEKGLGEPIRFLLSYGGIDFEDYRFDEDNWIELMPLMPFGRVPVLEIDGKKMHQSTAIARYLAEEFGLRGKDAWQNYEIDATVDTIHDLRLALAAYYYETNEQAKKDKCKPLFGKTIPLYLDRLDAQVKRNTGYLVDGRLTWADIFFVALLDNLNYMASNNIIEDYVNLEALKTKVLEIPQLKAWIEKRPRSDF